MSVSFINAVDPTTIIFIVLLVVLIVALLVVPMFTNKKRAKQTEELHRSLRPGDVIKTVGGVIGTIKEIRQVSQYDKEMVIETGSGDNKTTMTFDIQALYQVMSRGDAPAAPADEDKTEKLAAQEAAPAIAEPEAEKTAEAPVEEKAEAETPVADTTAEQAAVDVAEPEQAQAEESAPKAESKPAAKKSTSAAKKPASKKPIAKNK